MIEWKYDYSFQNALKEVLDYNLSTGYFIWKIDYNRRNKIGKRAGGYKKSGNRRTINIFGKQVYEHQIAFFYMQGRCPLIIDHRNQDSTDNSWYNLRPANASINSRNIKLPNNNTSSVIGVRILNRGGKRFQASILGEKCQYFYTLEEAKQCRLNMQKLNHYSSIHGVKK